MTPWSDGYVNTNGLKLHYYRTGGQKPPLVLSHGATDDGLCWTMLASSLQADYDIIMLDARGHGLSDSGQGDYSSAARTADLAGAIQALGLEKPVIGGHSMGADSSIHLAIQHPHLVSAIFLEDPPLALPDQPIFGGQIGDQMRGENLEHTFKFFSRMMLVMKITPLFIGAQLARKFNPTYPNDAIIPWVKSKKHLSPDFRKALQQMADWRVPYELLKRVQVPALLLVGDREQGAIVSKEAALEVTHGLSNFQVVHFPGASHDIRRFDFPRYAQELRNFIAEVYES